MSTVLLLAAAAPIHVPPNKAPGLIFTVTLCLIFIIWGATIGLSAYRARAQKNQLHGGAWGVTGPWQQPVPRFSRPPQFGPAAQYGPPPGAQGPPPPQQPQGPPPPQPQGPPPQYRQAPAPPQPQGPPGQQYPQQPPPPYQQGR